ncbi:MAG: helix-turn-helix domain-containing protein [bacterium]
MSKDIITNNRQLDKGNNEMDRQLSINFEENTWYFTKVQNEVLLDEDLSTVNKMVYVALSKFAGERNTCYPSKAKISKIASCGKTAVYNSIRTLEEKGYIVKQERKEKTEEGKIRNKSNLYKIKDLKYLSKFRKYAEDNNDQELLDILSLEPIPTFDEL